MKFFRNLLGVALLALFSFAAGCSNREATKPDNIPAAPGKDEMKKPEMPKVPSK
ncbi:MAG: hypothetical protein HYX68_03340 [Planctomycetes bacterium]|jgi:ABC-type phosphate/phosphonate transport system substrate-binding protein|nr:hypothetical protein [Planctomycetota bacterium]